MSTHSLDKQKEVDVTERSVSSNSSSPRLRAADEKGVTIEAPSPASISLENQSSPPPVYHVFTRTRKLQIVCIVSLAAIFSPLSSNIYFPALGMISRKLGVSMSLTTLTVTVYMIVQGLAPSFWGSFSDVMGRRGIFIATFIVYIIANIALAVSTNYGELMAFRALQAAGSAATISIGAGVIGDITTSAERGSLIGIFGGVRMLGQGIGPVFGGILSQYLGYKSIFWFLTIVSGVSLLSIVVFLPETLRPIAGNGTVRLHGISKPLIYYITGQKEAKEGAQPIGQKKKVSFKTKDVFITLFFGAIVYTVWSMVTSSTSDLFESRYGLTTLEVGLTFLGNGFGCMSGSYTIGYLMDYNHKRTERDYCRQNNLPPRHPHHHQNTSRFPDRVRPHAQHLVDHRAVHRVHRRVRRLLRTHLAVPIILQYILAYCATAIFTINSALIIDLYPGASASATAVNNLMRCLIGAAGVAAVQPIIDALTAEWCFVLLAGITLVMVPLLAVEMRWGPGWRAERSERFKRKAEQKEARKAESS
ncbi:hypothetical protein N7470_003100 [Penicillium chermesinum]|nr:hypothetical protein N7470_003100 [Penicillium chermesinum]